MRGGSADLTNEVPEALLFWEECLNSRLSSASLISLLTHGSDSVLAACSSSDRASRLWMRPRAQAPWRLTRLSG